jgi:hypothetical protein
VCSYVRAVGKEYVKVVLADIVASVAQDPDLDLEIDKRCGLVLLPADSAAAPHPS